MWECSRCKNISAIMTEIGDPMGNPLSGWYIFLKLKVVLL